MQKVITDSAKLTKGQQSLAPKIHFRLVDVVTFIYLSLLSLLIVVFYGRIESAGLYLLAHIMTVALLLAYFRFAEINKTWLVQFFREIYPLVLFTFFFKEISLILNQVFSFWFEGYLMAWDKWLIGDYATVFVQKYYRPWLTEFMAFSYWSYYLIMPVGGLIIFFRCSRQRFQSFAFNLAFTMYMCYLCFFTLAARGPQQTLADLHLSREAVGFFDAMVLQIQATANISGSAFPSSHVAAVCIVLIYLFRYKKWLGWVTTPLIFFLTVSTVYMQYHYIADAMAGVLFVGITYPLGRVLEKRFGEGLLS